MISLILDASRPLKRLLSVSYDILAIPVAIYLALALRYGTLTPPFDKNILGVALATTLLTVAVFIKLGLYRAVVRFMTSKAFSTLALGIAVSATILATMSFLLPASIPRSSILIYFFTAFALLGTPRLFIRSVVSQLGKIAAEPVIIYGAGKQGIALAQALSSSEVYRPYAFIDDSPKKTENEYPWLKGGSFSKPG